MKLLTLQDLNVEDSLALYWSGTFDPQMEIERALEPFLEALEKYAGEWMPDIVEGKRTRKYSRAAVSKSLAEERDRYGSIIGLYREAEPAVSMTMSFRLEKSPRYMSVRLHVQPLTFFMQEERCRKFMELVRAWSSSYPVPHATGHSTADEQLADAPNYGRDDKTSYRDGFDKI